ncbi:c-type cytochrome [Larkinella insperata]|uniref:C-type cytochrome n=1 Tax=Larkinella insperata TaxID=332158 RepID=A0ABW3QJ50_9BACT|nr:cytochrome c [Larkinella insperata]
MWKFYLGSSLLASVFCTACLITSGSFPRPVNQTRPDTLAWPKTFGFGKPVTTQQLTRLDTDVRPDGKGLPAGSGTARQGKPIYAAKCASCHGPTGVEGPNDQLVIIKGLTDPAAKAKNKVIGNYWPYATTVFDYIKRAMPFNQPGSLSDPEVYSLTAFLLHANGIIKETDVMNAQTLPNIQMPNRGSFVPDDRLSTPAVR